MSIWNKGKDAGNQFWGQTKNAASLGGNKTWTVTRDFHVNSYNKGVSGAKWVGNKVKFW